MRVLITAIRMLIYIASLKSFISLTETRLTVMHNTIAVVIANCPKYQSASKYSFQRQLAIVNRK